MINDKQIHQASADTDTTQPVQWLSTNSLRLLDQSRLPLDLHYIDCNSVDTLAEAIRSLKVRGAPAIGIAAAYGLCLAALSSQAADPPALILDISSAADTLRATRPTAVNLGWALDTVLGAARSAEWKGVDAIKQAVLETAQHIERENNLGNAEMGRLGADLLHSGMNILTHCNAGPLAACGIGTALGVIYSAHVGGKELHVWVDETRPVLQGSRLTAWELMRWKVPCTLIADNMAASLMAAGRVDAVITGADRIAANGDTANKIGTYGLATLAHAHHIPFYVAAPLSTVDPAIPTGKHIEIEERSPAEVTGYGDARFAPEGVSVYNPAFDVTPYHLITAIITEAGVLRAPYDKSIAEVLSSTSHSQLSTLTQ